MFYDLYRTRKINTCNIHKHITLKNINHNDLDLKYSKLQISILLFLFFLYCAAHMLMLGSSCYVKMYSYAFQTFKCISTQTLFYRKMLSSTTTLFYFGKMLHQDAHISDEASVMYSRAKQVIMDAQLSMNQFRKYPSSADLYQILS